MSEITRKDNGPQVTRDWVVMPQARRAALAAWVALRADENRRAEVSLARFDATARATEQNLRTGEPLADHASRAMPISGIHVLPVFGKGEHVAPFIGERTATDPFIGPRHARGTCDHVTCQDNAGSADAWGYVAERTTGDAFMARVMHVMTSEAIDHGRPVDWSKVDDVASVARLMFIEKMSELMTREDVYAIRAEADTPTHVTTMTPRGLVTREVERIGGFIEWGVPREMRCGQCEGCKLARESGSASRASRYSVKGCDAPRSVVEWVTPSRILSRSVWQAAGLRSLATSSVYATRTDGLRQIAAGVAEDERVSIDGTDALSHVPPGVADVLRLIASACAITGDNVVAHNNGLSPAARSLLCLVMGTADTKAGATTALDRVRKVYTPEPRRERAERRARERCEREHATVYVPSCRYCAESMNTDDATDGADAPALA